MARTQLQAGTLTHPKNTVLTQAAPGEKTAGRDCLNPQKSAHEGKNLLGRGNGRHPLDHLLLHLHRAQKQQRPQMAGISYYNIE